MFGDVTGARIVIPCMIMLLQIFMNVLVYEMEPVKTEIDGTHTHTRTHSTCCKQDGHSMKES